MTTPITLQGLRKQFGGTVAVRDVSLEITRGDLFFLLGPSGCGKTTLLRLIAGFLDPTAGAVRFGDRDVTRLPPNKRNAGMVFQSYALWPHMTVRENVEFGLKARKTPRAERRARVERALESVRMLPYADRRPAQLSGGQQQRVALARALVVEPDVLLLDEPLSNLDAQLRIELRDEIRRVCRATGVTAVYVTHDQKEALSMADRVAVMRQGKIVQVGAPRDLYERPASRFVADFLGPTNYFDASPATPEGGLVRIETTDAGPLLASAAPPPAADGALTCLVRPESLSIIGPHTAPNGHMNKLAATHVETVYLGEVAQHTVRLRSGAEVRVFELNPRVPRRPGEPLTLGVDPAEIVLLPRSTA